MLRLRRWSLAGAAIAVAIRAVSVEANPASAKLRQRGAAELYNLDRDQAEQTFRAAILADPQDAAAHRGLASVFWVTIAFDRGAMSVDSYLGGITRQDVKLPPPPQALAADFHRSVDTAIALTQKRLS